MQSMVGLFAHRSVVNLRVAALGMCVVPIYRLRGNLRVRIIFCSDHKLRQGGPCSES
jgi:hypothetical protein